MSSLLNIRDPRAHKLAKELAKRRKTTMTAAVIDALEKELARVRRPRHERLSEIGQRLRAKHGPPGPDLTREERDAMWER